MKISQAKNKSSLKCKYFNYLIPRENQNSCHLHSFITKESSAIHLKICTLNKKMVKWILIKERAICNIFKDALFYILGTKADFNNKLILVIIWNFSYYPTVRIVGYWNELWY